MLEIPAGKGEVFDAHEANLYDVDAKYGDVVPVDEVLKYLEEISAAHAR
ncbi:MAG: hypothetical protein LC751_00295 [Actinobacteria bacterium]|nr:hypothetical protein [Actinomycetota bacterium]MCA1739093.1 hypothetical protein [Actinomycetota bacterium]